MATILELIGTGTLGLGTGLFLAYLFDVFDLGDLFVGAVLGSVVTMFVFASIAGWTHYKTKFAWRREQARRRRAAMR
jgi:hypothetical protein